MKKTLIVLFMALVISSVLAFNCWAGERRYHAYDPVSQRVVTVTEREHVSGVVVGRGSVSATTTTIPAPVYVPETYVAPSVHYEERVYDHSYDSNGYGNGYPVDEYAYTYSDATELIGTLAGVASLFSSGFGGYDDGYNGGGYRPVSDYGYYGRRGYGGYGRHFYGNHRGYRGDYGRRNFYGGHHGKRFYGGHHRGKHFYGGNRNHGGKHFYGGHYGGHRGKHFYGGHYGGYKGGHFFGGHRGGHNYGGFRGHRGGYSYGGHRGGHGGHRGRH
jgi:hypothetical protein